MPWECLPDMRTVDSNLFPARKLDSSLFFIESRENALIAVSKRILEESAMIKKLTELFRSVEMDEHEKEATCGSRQQPFPLPSMSGYILSGAIIWIDVYSKQYEKWKTMTDVELKNDAENLLTWKGLGEDVVQHLFNSPSFFELFQAAEFLEIRSLVVACCKFSASILSRQTADELRLHHRLPRDISAEEEEEMVDQILRIQICHLPVQADFNQRPTLTSATSEQDSCVGD